MFQYAKQFDMCSTTQMCFHRKKTNKKKLRNFKKPKIYQIVYSECAAFKDKSYELNKIPT